MIPSMDATKAINFHRKEALVVATSSALREWNEVSERRNLDIDLTDCMDRAPAVGLGLAIAQPNRKVLVLDCDATLRTDLGSLATVGQSETENLVHFVFDDATETLMKFRVIETLGKELQEGLDRDQRVPNFMHDLGNESAECGESIELLDCAVEAAHAFKR